MSGRRQGVVQCLEPTTPTPEGPALVDAPLFSYPTTYPECRTAGRAGGGSRTRIYWMEASGSAVELRPRCQQRSDALLSRPAAPRSFVRGRRAPCPLPGADRPQRARDRPRGRRAGRDRPHLADGPHVDPRVALLRARAEPGGRMAPEARNQAARLGGRDRLP